MPAAGHRLWAAVRRSTGVRGVTDGLRPLTVGHRRGAGHRLVARRRLLRPARARSRPGRLRAVGARLSGQRRPVVAA
ncbi:hypothetical protein DQ392_26850 [Streptomyces reniochalinae]|uniref:Uncharacterized protein n=1 Tax=Streptomyces reniochalinae TaxID=2250578 RepID=A0A367EAH7_9ACTN|nr:hypothetical protein DQ392_26850 [Streptomyces reniochalinae]